MKPFFPSFLVVFALITAPLDAQAWTQKPTDERISLIDANGKATVLDPGVAQPSALTRSLLGASATWRFEIRGATADSVVDSPVTIDLGSITPKKRNLMIQVVKLTGKGKVRMWNMKSSRDGFYAASDSEVFDENTRPLPTRGENGRWIITIPKSLVPGEYAVVSDGDVWDFTVKK